LAVGFLPAIDGRTVFQVQVRRVVRFVGIALGVLVVIALGLVVLVMSTFGDPEPPPGVQIVNRTDQHLKVYSLVVTVDPDVPDRRLIAEIPPNRTAEAAGGPCILDEVWVARAPDRTIVARIGPFDYCNEGPWMIRPKEPEP
jgi:hypothetical protein